MGEDRHGRPRSSTREGREHRRNVESFEGSKEFRFGEILSLRWNGEAVVEIEVTKGLISSGPVDFGLLYEKSQRGERQRN